MRRILSLFALLAATAAPVAAQDGAVGKPQEGGIGFQEAATKLARDIHWLDHMILIIITAIVILVCVLLAIVILRYNSRANPKPASFTHNTPVEVAWTIIPIVILVFIGAFSLPVLFDQQEIPEGEVNIKVTGNQWYWSYEYTDVEDVAFDSYMLGQPATMTSEDEEAGATAYIKSDALVHLLVSHGAALSGVNARGQTPLMVAELSRAGSATTTTRTSTGDLLRELGAETVADDQPPR